MQISPETNRLNEQKRYDEYRLFEEKTDLGERLSLPIENRLELRVDDGMVLGRDVTGEWRRMSEWARASLEAAQIDQAFDGANAVERVRRQHEYEEALAVEELSPGETMIVFSPIPDAALAGQTSIAGYRTDLARTFCRLYGRADGYVEAVTLTLEQSNKQGLKAAAEALGMSLPESMQSEAILAARYVLRGSVRDLPDRIRYHYDESLYRQTGTVFYAGNPLAGRQDSMKFIDTHQDLLDQHMASLKALEARLDPGSALDAEREALRRRTAAALDGRLHGEHVVSLGDSSVDERMGANNYGGECATGATPGAAEQMGLSMGRKGESIAMTCPFCGLTTYGDPCASRIVCGKCSAEVRNGKVVSQGIGRAAALRSRPSPVRRTATPQRQKPSTPGNSLSKYGPYAAMRREITVGGERREIIDKRTGAVLARVS